MIAFKFFGNRLDHAVKERIQNASHYNSHCVLGRCFLRLFRRSFMGIRQRFRCRYYPIPNILASGIIFVKYFIYRCYRYSSHLCDISNSTHNSNTSYIDNFRLNYHHSSN